MEKTILNFEEHFIPNIRYSDRHERNVLDIYLPEQNPSAVMVYFHGGGLTGGKKENVATLAKKLCDRGIAVAAPNYPLYPDTVFPQFLEDAATAVAWVKKNLIQHFAAKLIIGGSSAGAYITAMLAYNPAYLNAVAIRTTDIDGYIINSAQPTTHFTVLKMRGLDSRRIWIDDAAPLYYINENTVFPRVLIVTADHDMPCRYEQNLVLLQTLKMFGCPQQNAQYVLMENEHHCSYDRTDKFSNILYDFITSDSSEGE